MSNKPNPNNKGLVIELKTCTTPPHTNSDIHKKNLAQLAIQMFILNEQELPYTPGLQRVNIKTEDGKKTHIYKLYQDIIPGITTVLNFGQTWKPPEIYLNRGTWAHQICERIDSNEVSGNWIQSLPGKADDFGYTPKDGELWRNWLYSYIDFKNDHNLNDREIKNEVPLASRSLKVAATLDKIVACSELCGGLLYLTGKKYRFHPLTVSKKYNSAYQQGINHFKMFKFVYDTVGAINEEHKKFNELNGDNNE